MRKNQIKAAITLLLFIIQIVSTIKGSKNAIKTLQLLIKSRKK